MTQEDKDLLFKDLCARLPYGVKMRVIDKTLNADYPDILGIDVLIPRNKYEDYRFESGDWIIYLDDVRPYLRLMSSMTDEEKLDVKINYHFFCNDKVWENVDIFTIGGTYDRDGNYDEPRKVKETLHVTMEEMLDFINWLNEHHFDYRGLIEKGLALEAPDGMYKV